MTATARRRKDLWRQVQLFQSNCFVLLISVVLAVTANANTARFEELPEDLIIAAFNFSKSAGGLKPSGTLLFSATDRNSELTARVNSSADLSDDAFHLGPGNWLELTPNTSAVLHSCTFAVETSLRNVRSSHHTPEQTRSCLMSSFRTVRKS